MKTTVAFLSLLASATLAMATPSNVTNKSRDNVICLSDDKVASDKAAMPCKQYSKKDLAIPKLPAWGTAPYYVYKSQAPNSVAYSDSAPVGTVYQKIDLNSDKMKEGLSIYKTDMKMMQEAKRLRRDEAQAQKKRDEINHIRENLSQARGALYSLRPETDADWTYSGRTRVLSPYYVDKQVMLKNEILKFQTELENKF